MRRLEYQTNGAPWDRIMLADGPTPDPAGGEVIVELEAAPVHIADLKAIEGNLDFIPRGPGVPGFEGVGRIIATGDDSSGWNIGDRVILPLGYGAWQEHRAVACADLWRAPDHVPAEQLALVRINLTTAYLLLTAYRTLKPGDWIIQNAANSNVASYVASLARARGIGVVDLVRRPELIPALKASGRQHVILDEKDAIAALCDTIDARPALALDAVGGEATVRLGNVTADGGLVLAYGFLSEQPYAIDYPDAMFRNVSLAAMMIDRASEMIGRAGRDRMAADLQTFIASEPLNAEIAAVYNFDQAADALRHAAQTGQDRAGKIILVPTGSAENSSGSMQS